MERYLPRPRLEGTLTERLEEGRKLLVLSGPRGSGKSTLLRELRRRWVARTPSLLVEVEPITASPEILCQRFLALGGEHLASSGDGTPTFERLLRAVSHRSRDLTLFLDEITELRTLSYFPGVDQPLTSFLEALARPKAPRAMVTSRFPKWLDASLDVLPPAARARVETLELPPLGAEELAAVGYSDAHAIVAATGGLPVHLAPLLSHIDAGGSLENALAVGLSPGGRLEAECRATLAQLLQRARGYGACKAVLAVLAEEEGLTLTEVARRLNRTAGSTRDYLRWLEEVELVTVREKRFRFVDPVLRLWLRLYARGEPPSERDFGNEVEKHLDGVPLMRDVELPHEDLIEID